MGWTFTSRGYGVSVCAFFEQTFNYENENGSGKVLDYALVQRSVAYFAYERINKEGLRYVVALVCPVRFKPRALDGYDFGYKDMDESVGPVEDDCPRRILEQLSPLDQVPGHNKWAKDWRDRCWANIERAKVKPGTVIKLEAPVSFTNGHQADTFTIVKRSTVRSHGDGGLYRIRNLRRQPFQIVAP